MRRSFCVVFVLCFVKWGPGYDSCSGLPASEQGRPDDDDDQLEHHHNYEEMLESMDRVHRRCPDITHLYNLSGNPDTTVEGRKLAVIVISENPDRHEIGTEIPLIFDERKSCLIFF